MKIVYFAPIEYDGLMQRPQELAKALAKYAEVYYIEPTISFSGFLKNHSLKFWKEKRRIHERLHIWRLSGFLALPIRFQYLDLYGINTIYERWQLRKLFKMADVVIIGYEPWIRLFKAQNKKKIIYDKMDDNQQIQVHPRIRAYLKQCEDKIIECADAIFVTAQIFKNQLEKRHSKVFTLSNAVDGVIADMPNMITLSNKEEKLYLPKRFGYVGMISHWFDNEFIKYLSEKMPGAEIILVGPCEIEKIEAHNVTYVGRVEKSEVFKWISSFDICLYPFKSGGFINTINPVKIYEYLAFNKPVLAVESTETILLKRYLYLYQEKSDLDKILSIGFREPFKSQEELRGFIQNNSWEQRAKCAFKYIKNICD